MARQSVFLTRPNDECLKAQVRNEEYSSKSKLVNDLIRQAREQQKEVDRIHVKLIRAEENLKTEGYVNKSSDEILADLKERAKASYRPSPDAEDNLYRIWFYGAHKFGIAQYDKCYQAFFHQFDIIAKDPFLFASVDYIREGYRRGVSDVDSIIIK